MINHQLNYYYRNQEERIKYQKNYYKLNFEKYKIYNKNYYKKNYEMISQKKKNKRKDISKKFKKNNFNIEFKNIIINFN
jgi:fibronectin type 3 domain-containing protein